MSSAVPGFALRQQLRRLPFVLGLLLAIAAIAVALATTSVGGDRSERLL
jgi:hypothetical protein